MKKLLMPHLARFVSSNTLLELKRSLYELKRKATQQPYELEVFLHINDPYSYLLVQVLSDIDKRYNINLRLRTIYQINHEMFPEQEMWDKNAFDDATRLADLYSLKMPKKRPNKTNKTTDNTIKQLVEAETSTHSHELYCKIFHHYWQQDDTEHNNSNTEETINSATCTQSYKAVVKLNEARLRQLGHYMAAMIYFGGEWYWGLDRLDHFEKRANRMGLSKESPPVINYNRTYHNFCNNSVGAPAPKEPPLTPLTLFFSIRSPYSHIGLERAVKLAKHYDIELIVKPVLPMMMRGLSVPNAKKMYIFHDTKREAQKYGIDYGYVADPLGAGVERCYALFEYAESQGKSVEYLLAYARAVNAQGIRSETDKGLKKILLSCGLDWQTAKPLLNNKSWNAWADQNLQEMYSYGLWGVPSLKYKNTTVWGQDRIFVIENEIINDKR